MRSLAATQPGSTDTPTEDWHYTDPHIVVVLDGGTVRTDTGCVHGVPWYVSQLGHALVRNVVTQPRRELTQTLARAIEEVAASHPNCDLSHPGTPSAAATVVVDHGDAIHWLVLGDITLVKRTGDHVTTIIDDRVSYTASEARSEADRYPIGSEAKTRALLRMKNGELADRNTPGGYWIAAANPAAAEYARTGSWRHWDSLAVLTDGAARCHQFRLMSWLDMFYLLQTQEPAALIKAVRQLEESDPDGTRWPRNKSSDDATAVYLTPGNPPLKPGDRVRSQWEHSLVGHVVAVRDEDHLQVKWDSSPVPVEMPPAEVWLISPTTPTDR